MWVSLMSQQIKTEDCLHKLSTSFLKQVVECNISAEVDWLDKHTIVIFSIKTRKDCVFIRYMLSKRLNYNRLMT